MEVLHAAAARALEVAHDPADPVEVEQPSPDLMPMTPPDLPASPCQHRRTPATPPALPCPGEDEDSIAFLQFFVRFFLQERRTHLLFFYVEVLHVKCKHRICIST